MTNTISICRCSMDCPARLLLWGLSCLLSACSGASNREIREPLPFIVRIDRVEVPTPDDSNDSLDGETEAPVGGGPAIPPRFESPEVLRERFAIVLEESGLFTKVVTSEGAEAHPDLEIDIDITGDDFGKGSPTLGASISSTLAWLFTGHLSWLIENRQYPDSNIMLYLTIRVPDENGHMESTIIFRDDLLLNGLELNLLERADTGDWFMSILLPPWWGDGAPEVAGASLARRTVDFFASHEVGRVVSRFPLEYRNAFSSYLVHDPDGKRVIIISKEAVRQVDITGPAGRRSIGEEKLDYSCVRGAASEEIRRQLSRRNLDLGMGTPDPQSSDWFYPIDLQDDETGYLHIEALVGRHHPEWTILRPPAPDEALVQVTSRG